jgi:type I restriction-modification system DNA methylase subunit
VQKLQMPHSVPERRTVRAIAGYDWQKTDIVLPNDLFTNDEAVEEGIVGTGVLDVFDRYNFTVNESEPLEKEVAIDPEMLGKVFENLIEDNRRKGLGAFYTPREIVHFMCQESLINYLDTALNGVPAPIQAKTESQGGLFGAEPAQMTLPSAGKKGALPREDIETFIRLGEQISHYESVEADYRVKMPKSIEKNAKALDDALKSITVCDPAVGSGAFPVGMLTEIIRARLSLTPYFNEAGERTPYHFKRHAIQNCLYGVDIDSGAVEIAKLRLWLSLVVDEEDVKQIKPLPNLDYKIVSGNSLLCVEKDLFNLQLFQKLEELKTRYFDQTDHAEKSSIRTQINHIINQLTNGRAAFDFEIYYSEVFHAKRGFDVVIMNPPYGAEFSEDENKYLKNKYDHIVERIRNSFLYFMGLGYDIARHGGIVSTIEPNEFLFQIYMTKARRYFVGNAQILYAINTGEDVFKAIVPTCVLALRKLKMGSYKIPIADLRGCTLGELPHRLKTNDFAATSSDIVLGTPNSIFAFDLDSASLVNKLSESCTAFEMFCDDVANGISTSCDNIYIVPKEHAERERYEKEYVKPCIRGGQFNRYYCPADTGDRILYVTDEYVTKEGRRILKYLTEHKSLLIEKCVEKKQGKREWHVLFRGRYEELFKGRRL